MIGSQKLPRGAPRQPQRVCLVIKPQKAGLTKRLSDLTDFVTLLSPPAVAAQSRPDTAGISVTGDSSLLDISHLAIVASLSQKLFTGCANGTGLP